jgi:hypothetical protein
MIDRSNSKQRDTHSPGCPDRGEALPSRSPLPHLAGGAA